MDVPIWFLAGPKKLVRTYGTQGDLTPNFPTFAKPVLNLEFYMNADPEST